MLYYGSCRASKNLLDFLPPKFNMTQGHLLSKNFIFLSVKIYDAEIFASADMWYNARCYFF